MLDYCFYVGYIYGVGGLGECAETLRIGGSIPPPPTHGIPARVKSYWSCR